MTPPAHAGRGAARFVAAVLGAPRASELAAFYSRLTGWPVAVDEGEWAMVRDPRGGAGLSFQTEEGYVPPVWPEQPGAQQMMIHLDLAVPASVIAPGAEASAADLDAAVETAIALGARLAEHQPQDGVRVLFDPAGHPFCLFPDLVAADEVCRAYLDAFASGDPNEVLRWVTDDFVNEHTAALGSGCTGSEEYARRLPGFLASMPGLRYEVHHVVAERDRAAAAYTLHATVNGREVAVQGAMHFELHEGRIRQRTDYWDSLVFQRQAGLV